MDIPSIEAEQALLQLGRAAFEAKLRELLKAERIDAVAENKRADRVMAWLDGKSDGVRADTQSDIDATIKAVNLPPIEARERRKTHFLHLLKYATGRSEVLDYLKRIGKFRIYREGWESLGTPHPEWEDASFASMHDVELRFTGSDGRYHFSYVNRSIGDSSPGHINGHALALRGFIYLVGVDAAAENDVSLFILHCPSLGAGSKDSGAFSLRGAQLMTSAHYDEDTPHRYLKQIIGRRFIAHPANIAPDLKGDVKQQQVQVKEIFEKMISPEDKAWLGEAQRGIYDAISINIDLPARRG